MTAQRQERNGSRSGTGFRPGIALIALWASLARITLVSITLVSITLVSIILVSISPGAQAATTERVVVNRFTGLAIEGFDPVAYFADARPVVGLPEYETSESGAVWRFRNASNRASFVAHPDIYGPQFGGYDPIDLARGVTFAGNPLFWLVSGERLYLFGREQSRDAFAANPAAVLREANQRWPELEQTLAR
jgi:hypothetical protein